MGSIRLNGVRFTVYTMDYAPRHVHGFYADIEVIVDLCANGGVSLANRSNAILPSNGNKADVKHILGTAANHFERLAALWERHHG